jgi:3-phenylpropionate/cinnamic acid dioxygenase small subunit
VVRNLTKNTGAVMSRVNLAVVLCVSLGVGGAGWVYAEQSKAASPLTTQDVLEIHALYANYAHALDKGEGDRFAATFTPDGEFTAGRGPGRASEVRTPRKGTEELKKMGSGGGGRHFISNIVLTPTPEGVSGSAYLLLYNARTIPPSFVETAIYEDYLVKTPQGWRFKKRIVWRDDDDITPFKPKPRS